MANSPLRCLKRSSLCRSDAGGCLCRVQPAVRSQSPARSIVEAACWAHSRRKFFDLARIGEAPIATDAIARIDALFVIEREINGMTLAERV